MRHTFLTGLTISRKFLLAVLALCIWSQAPLQATPLSMSGNTYWRQNGGMVTIHVDRISNTSTNETSGSLRLRLWATPTRYTGGGAISGFVVASQGLSPLGPNQYFPDVNSLVRFYPPPSGTYYSTLALEEYTNSGWVTRDYVTYNTTITGSGGGGGAGTPSGGAVLDISGNTSWQQNGNALTIHVDRVSNTSSSATSGSLRLQLWATALPYSGGSISGYVLGSYPFSQVLGPNQYYSDVTQTVTFTAPPNGTYYTTLTLEEYSGSAWVIRDHVTYSSTQTWGPNGGGGSNPPAGPVLSMSGNTSWQQNGNRVTLKVDRVSNTGSSGISGSLRLQLWATVSPYAGGTIRGYTLGSYQFPETLGPNEYYPAVTQTVTFTAPPDGSYYTTMTLEEYTSSGWVNRDYVTFDTTTTWRPVTNTSPFGFVDYPSQGTAVNGTIAVHGWTLDGEDSNLTITLSVDGQLVSSNPTRSARPDVCIAFPALSQCSSSNPGWTFNWNTQAVSNGSHTLTILVRDPQGAQISLFTNVTVANASTTNTPPFGYMDYPPQAATVSGTIPVWGWALDAEDSNLSISFSVDGQVVSSIPSRAPRPDVCRAFPSIARCSSSNPGWTFNWNTQAVSNGSHRLSVVVRDPQGGQVSFVSSVSVSNTAANNTAPFGNLDAPATGTAVSGTVPVWGWALDAEDSNLTISLSVDGQLVSSAPARSSRLDVCKAYPAIAHCNSSNPGWSFNWNTQGISNGSHTLSVVVRDPKGIQSSLSTTVNIQAQPAIITSIGTGSNFSPSGVAVLGGGFLVVADTLGHRIIKISATGAITVIAGTGTAGFNGDGPATSRQLNSPSGVAVDGAGYIYIADTLNHRIRQISPSGMMTTIAGTGTAGFTGDGGSPLRAALNYPSAVAVDASFRVYVADMLNNRIRKIANSVITTVAGDGTFSGGADGTPATSGGMYQPRGVAADAYGNVLFSDSGNNCVRHVDTSGIVTTIAGRVAQGYCVGEMGSAGDGGSARSALLADPWGIDIDLAGNVYIAERVGNRIRRITPDGRITTVAGDGTAGFSGDNGPATSAQLHSPAAVVSDYFSSAVYIADTFNNRVRKVSFLAK